MEDNGMKRTAATAFFFISGLVTITPVAHAGWLDAIKDFASSPDSSKVAGAVLANEDIIGGLKEALVKGTRWAIDELGRADGFLGNERVRIPLPDSLKTVESTLRALRQDRYADEFIETMNHAAEQAVPEAVDILTGAVSQMTVEDARGILDGPDDAATQYFKRTSTDALTERLRPIIEVATARTGVTAAYKRLMNQAGMVTQFLSRDVTDVDGYVTGKALDGLFLLIADEEKRIRKDPVARTTDLLKKVFGK